MDEKEKYQYVKKFVNPKTLSMPQMLAAEEKMFRLKTKIPDMAGFSNKFGEVITLADFALAVYRLGWVFKMPTGIDELANVGVTVKSNDTAPSLGIGSG